MELELSWKKKIFSNLCRIYSNGQLVGTLRYFDFSRTAVGELNGKKYSFKVKGIFEVHTEITDCQDDNVIGKITYNAWSTKATILLNGKLMDWKYDDIWKKEFSISNSEGVAIRYSGSILRGQAYSNTCDALLLLTGLYVPGYFADKIRRCA